MPYYTIHYFRGQAFHNHPICKYIQGSDAAIKEEIQHLREKRAGKLILFLLSLGKDYIRNAFCWNLAGHKSRQKLRILRTNVCNKEKDMI